MIFITGDTHKEFRRFTTENFPEQYQMTKDDVLIILGDFGALWYEKETNEEEWWLDWFESKNFTTLFIDGNHENFDRLYRYPVEKRYEGKVHVLRPSVLHLMRGEVFEIQGKKFFAFGGASSHDVSDGIIDGTNPNWKKIAKMYQGMGRYLYRVKGISWWEQELPSEEEMQNGRENMKEHGYKVDYVLTHTPPKGTLQRMGVDIFDSLTEYLEDIRYLTDYSYWFSGHMHEDRKITDKDIVLFTTINQIL